MLNGIPRRSSGKTFVNPNFKKRENLHRHNMGRNCCSFRPKASAVATLYPYYFKSYQEGAISLSSNSGEPPHIALIDRKAGNVLFNCAMSVTRTGYREGEALITNNAIYYLFCCYNSLESSPESYLIKLDLNGNLQWIRFINGLKYKSLAYANNLIYVQGGNHAQSSYIEPKIFNPDGSSNNMTSNTLTGSLLQFGKIGFLNSSSGLTNRAFTIYTHSSTGLSNPSIAGDRSYSISGWAASAIALVDSSYLIAYTASSPNRTLFRLYSSSQKTICLNLTVYENIGIDLEESSYFLCSGDLILKLDKNLKVVYLLYIDVAYRMNNKALVKTCLSLLKDYLYIYLNVSYFHGDLVILDLNGGVVSYSENAKVMDVTSRIIYLNDAPSVTTASTVTTSSNVATPTTPAITLQPVFELSKT